MSRRRQPQIAQKKIRAVIAWARNCGFHHVAVELQDALLLLPGEDEIHVVKRAFRDGRKNITPLNGENSSLACLRQSKK